MMNEEEKALSYALHDALGWSTEHDQHAWAIVAELHRAGWQLVPDGALGTAYDEGFRDGKDDDDE
jgi:hypothetical protein